jgi:hypothetical protein
LGAKEQVEENELAWDIAGMHRMGEIYFKKRV